MTFITHTPGRTNPCKDRDTETVKVRLHNQRYMQVVLPMEVAERLGWTPFETRLSVYRGIGDNLGEVALGPYTGTGYCVNVRRAGRSSKKVQVYFTMDVAGPTKGLTKTPYTIKDDLLILRVAGLDT